MDKPLYNRFTFGSFDLNLPTGYTLSSVILAGPPDVPDQELNPMLAQKVKPFQRNIVATMERVGPEETPSSYLAKQIEGLRKAQVPRQEFKVESVLLNAVEGIITDQAITGPSGEVVRQLQLICIKNGVAHTLIASHVYGAAFDRVRAEFEQILKSFQ